MQLSQLSNAVSGQLNGSNVELAGIVTDTRVDCENRLFVALNGPNFNAHDYIQSAQQQGAVAALVEQDVETALPTVKVESTYKALLDMATWWRNQFDIPVVGITGSVGKTTVKEMVGSIFSQLGEGLVTKGNLNNEIGVPLTIMRLKQSDLYAVIEMGMNHAGEISRLTQVAKPTIALINNAGAAHLDDLGSVDAVAKAKQEIFEGLSENGIAIINADDAFAPMWKESVSQCKQLSFGIDKSADITASYTVHAEHIEMHVTALEKTFKVVLPALGVHNAKNALAAIAISVAANISEQNIIDGLANYKTVGGRLNASNLGELLVIDDTYNANPISMRAAVDVLAEHGKGEGETYLIVGDMGELGDAVVAAHIELGQYAQEKGIGAVYACGDYAEQVTNAFKGTSMSFATQAELITFLSNHIPSNGVCLVKGSRFTRMEKVVDYIKQKHQNTQVSKGAHTC